MKNLRRWRFFKYLSWLLRYLFNGFGYHMKKNSCDAISVKDVCVYFSKWNDLNRDFESQLWLRTGIESGIRTRSKQRWLCFAWLQYTAIGIKYKSKQTNWEIHNRNWNNFWNENCNANLFVVRFWIYVFIFTLPKGKIVKVYPIFVSFFLSFYLFPPPIEKWSNCFSFSFPLCID